MLSHPRALPAGFIAPCLPSSAPQPPNGEDWLHEIKHDGFRVIARKSGDRVKLTAGRATISLTASRSSSRRSPGSAPALLHH
jgi:ATP-dependent DNA ligase